MFDRIIDQRKALALPRRHKKECDICKLLDTQSPSKTKWFIYKEGINESSDSYICENCFDGLKDIRRKCHQKIDNPNSKILEDFIPWFTAEIPGLAKAFKEKD